MMGRNDRAKSWRALDGHRVSSTNWRQRFWRGSMRRLFSGWRLMSQRCWRVGFRPNGSRCREQRSGRSILLGFVLVILPPTLCSLLLSRGCTERWLSGIGRKVCCLRSCSMEGSWMLPPMTLRRSTWSLLCTWTIFPAGRQRHACGSASTGCSGHAGRHRDWQGARVAAEHDFQQDWGCG